MILVSGLYHGSAFQAEEQIKNYFSSCKEIVQVVHISADSYSQIKPALEMRFKKEINEQTLIINPSSIKTTSQSGLVQHFLNLELAKRLFNKRTISHAYIHTSGDLLVKKSLEQYILKHDFGIGSHELDLSTNWPHVEKLKSSVLANRKQIFFGRCEGAFFPFDFYDDAFNRLMRSGTLFDFVDSDKAWPMEECFFATEMFEAGIKNFKENVIKTFDIVVDDIIGYQSSKYIDKNVVTREGVDWVVSNAKYFGAKWFALEHDSTREYVKIILER